MLITCIWCVLRWKHRSVSFLNQENESAYMLEHHFYVAISREVVYNGPMRPSISIPLSRKQKEIILGSILGDGCLEFNGNVGTRLQIKQSSKRKEYVFWLYENFKNLCRSNPKQKRDNYQWYFSTRSLKELTSFYDLFYPKGKKRIPDNISALVCSPLTLAIWFMDDGTLDYRAKDHYAYSLSTNSFSYKESLLLAKTMKDNFGIKASVHRYLCRGKRYPRVYIGSEGRDKFFSLVKPYVLNCFRYKLPPL